MKRFVTLMFVVLLLAGSAFAQSPYWGDITGEYLPAFDGQVLYDLDLIEAPISIPEPIGPWGGYWLGHALGDGNTLIFTDWNGHSYTGTFYAESGCYFTESPPVFDHVAIALCYDGDRSLDLYYGTLKWNGHNAVFEGPWYFHIYAFAPSVPVPMRMLMDRHSE